MNLFQNGANDMSEIINMVNDFCQKLHVLCNSDHLILFKFHQFVVNIFMKGLLY